MLFLIGLRIRLNTGFDQSQGDIAVLHGMTVFTIIEQTDAVMPLGHIHPFLSAALKPRFIPARVLMCLARQIAKLNLESRLIRVNIHRKMHFQEMLMLLPVDIRLKLNPSALCIKMNLLADQGIADLPGKCKRCPNRSVFDPSELCQLRRIPELFGIIDINIPVIVVDRLILIHTHQVRALTLF